MAQAFDRALAEAAERDARLREDGATDFRLADPVMRQRGGVALGCCLRRPAGWRRRSTIW